MAHHIHFYVHGHGRGHATGSMPIVEALRNRGDRVVVFAGGEAWPLFAGQSDAHPIDGLMPGDGLTTLPLLARRLRLARAWTAKSHPDCVVSDGDLPGVLAARSSGIPSIAVGHGVVFSHCRRPPELPRWPWWREALKARLATAVTARQVAVSFVPLSPLASSTVVARIAGGENPRLPMSRRGGIVCYFSGVDGRPTLRHLVALGESPTLFASDDPGIDGVDVRPLHRARFAEAVRGAAAVVSSAGSLLISECTGLGVPQFAIYERNHDEQRLNVDLLRLHQMGDGCPVTDVTPARLKRFLEAAAPPARPPWNAPEVAEAVLGWVDDVSG